MKLRRDWLGDVFLFLIFIYDKIKIIHIICVLRICYHAHYFGHNTAIRGRTETVHVLSLSRAHIIMSTTQHSQAHGMQTIYMYSMAECKQPAEAQR